MLTWVRKPRRGTWAQCRKDFCSLLSGRGTACAGWTSASHPYLHTGEKISKTSVADPDPYVYGPPESESWSISQRYDPDPDPPIIEAKIVRKTLIPTVLWLLFDFLSLKNDVNIPSKSNKQKTFKRRSQDPDHHLFWAVLWIRDILVRIRIRASD